jgi:predicted dehydrogenase
MPDKLRGAVIGCGFFSQFHIDAWRRMPDVEIVAAVDPDLARARAVAPNAYADAESLLAAETLDFADVVTRPDTHLPYIELFTSRGIPVICQKPMAADMAQARRMVEMAERTQVPLMFHENWRWQPWYRQTRRLIDDGAVGRVLSYSFRFRRADGLGPTPFPAQPYFKDMPRLLIYEAVVHPIDTSRFLFGEIRQITARIHRENPIIAGEDRCVLIQGHDRGLLGVIDGHRYRDAIPDGPAMGDAWVEGETGALWIAANGEIQLNGSAIWTPGNLPGYKGDSVLATQRHFIDCLRSGAPFESHARDYIRTFAVVDAAYQSAAEGRTVTIDYR